MMRTLIVWLMTLLPFSASLAETDIVYYRRLKGKAVSAVECVEELRQETAQSKDEVLASVKKRVWPEKVLLVDLVESDRKGTYLLRIITITQDGLTADFPGNGKLIFSRKGHEHFAHFAIRNLVDVHYGKDITADQVSEQARNRTWPKDVFLVQVLDAREKGTILRVYSLVDENAEFLEQQFLISERVRKEWGIGHGTENFAYEREPFELMGGKVTEIYHNKLGGAKVGVVHRRIESGDENDHGLFGQILSDGGGPVRATLSWGETEAGRALLVTWGRPGSKKVLQRRVLWRTAPDHIVDIGYFSENLDDLREIIHIYAKVFPSTIPATLNIDKTGWGRAEVALRLKGMQEYLAKEPDPFDPIQDRFERDLDLLNRVLKSPAEKAAKGNDERKKQLATLEQWWKENSEKTTWDEESGRLVMEPHTEPRVEGK